MKEQILFIINPNAGKRDSQQLPQLIEQYIDTHRFEVKLVFTEYAGHAPQLVKAHADFNVFVAVGGDGTVNEVASAVKSTNGALAIIPKGSGNGFARYIGMPMDSIKAIQFINKAQKHEMDMGQIGDHYFLATCGIGFDAEVAFDFAQRNHRGLKNYIKAIFHLYRSFPGFRAKMNIDGGVEQDISGWMLTAGNGNQWGNNAYICPEANAFDGQLSLTWVTSKIKWLEAPYFTYLLFTKKLHHHKKVNTLNFKEIQLKAYRGAMHYDGEPSAIANDITISILPKAINVLK